MPGSDVSQRRGRRVKGQPEHRLARDPYGKPSNYSTGNSEEPEFRFFAKSNGMGLRIRGHQTGPPSAQKLIMVNPSTQPGRTPRIAEAGAQATYFQALREQSPVYRSFRWNGYWDFV